MRQCLFPFLVCLGASSVWAQRTVDEFWPELDSYIRLNDATRILVLSQFKNHQDERRWVGDFGVHFDFALKPVFRRELREQDDVYLRKFLTFQTGYEYLTTLNDKAPYTENRLIIEVTARLPLPWKIVLSDRNRGDMRFISGESFSSRYRNKMQLERDFKADRCVFAPYISEEVFYDTRYDAWARNELSAGVEFPAGRHFIAATYYLRQTNTHSTPRHANVAGITLKLYH